MVLRLYTLHLAECVNPRCREQPGPEGLCPHHLRMAHLILRDLGKRPKGEVRARTLERERARLKRRRALSRSAP